MKTKEKGFVTDILKGIGHLLKKAEESMKHDIGDFALQDIDRELHKDHKLRNRVERGENTYVRSLLCILYSMGGYMNESLLAAFMADIVQILLQNSPYLMRMLYQELGKRVEILERKQCIRKERIRKKEADERAERMKKVEKELGALRS